MKKSSLFKSLLLCMVGLTFIQFELMATVVPGTLTLVSISPAPSGSNVLICDKQQLTVTFTYSGNVACTAYLTAKYTTISPTTYVVGAPINIPAVSGTYSFTHTVSQALDPTGTMYIVLQATGYTNKSLSLGKFLNINATPTAYTITNSSPVCNGAGSVSINLDASDMGISYQTYKGVAATGSAVSGDASGNQGILSPALGPFNTPGTYTVVATDGTTGCTSQMNGSVIINQTPATPTMSYTWCPTGGLKLHGSSATTGITSYYWRESGAHSSNQTASAADYVFTGASYNDNMYLSVSNGLCTSLETPVPMVVSAMFLPTPVISSLVYDNDCPGPCGLGSSTVNNPTGTYNLHSDAYTPTTHFWHMTCNTGSAGTTYQWYITNSILTGYTSTTFPTQPKINNAGGTFSMAQTNACGSVTSNAITVTFSAAGIGRKGLEETTDASSSSLLYPNPTNGLVNISVPYDTYTLSVINILGEEVLSKQINQNSTQIDVSFLSAGTYAVKIVSSEGNITKQLKVVK
jgi:hypothetical protein